MNIFETHNEYGNGVLKSWASILDNNTREKAEQISRVPVVEGHVALMPDAHFGYGPPVGTAMKTRNAIIPYAVGVDIGCGMIAAETNLERGQFKGLEGRILGAIRDAIPSGVGMSHDRQTLAAKNFLAVEGLPQGLENDAVMGAAMQKRHEDSLGALRLELKSKISKQFGTLGAGNHFVEVAETSAGQVWFILHSGSRGVGNVLATAHAKRAKAHTVAAHGDSYLEDKDFAFFSAGSRQFDAYVADMLWAQRYAYSNREAMMNELYILVHAAVAEKLVFSTTINCHHNYAEEVESGVWLTRKGAINAEEGTLGVIPGSMGAATYIVKGKGCAEALNTAPHGAGRVRSRGAAKRELDVDAFKEQMAGRTWQDRDAGKLIDEAPDAYKDLEVVMRDSSELVAPQVKLEAFINYKGL
jgi:tRNA-splicing ligase RtcB